jgi:hypothetical protein
MEDAMTVAPKNAASQRHSHARRAVALLLGAVVVASGLVVAAVPVAALATPEPTVDTSLLKNPGFENLTGGLPASWSFVSLAGSSVGASDGATSSEGLRSVTVSNTTSDSSGEWRSTALPVNETGVLQISVVGRTSAVDGKALVRVIYSNVAGVVGEQESDDVLIGTNNWTPLSMVSSVPKNAVSATIAVRLSGVGVAGFDWVNVEQPGQYNRLSNPSSEVANSGGGPANWSIAGQASTAQATLNGGFESSPAASGWWAAKWAGTSTLTAGPGTRYAGSNAAKISSSDPATEAGWVNMNNGSYYDVTPGQTYTMNVFVNVASLGVATSGDARVQVSAMLRDNALSATKEVTAPAIEHVTSGWTMVRLSFTPSVGWNKVRFTVKLYGAGEVYVDSLNWAQTSWGRDASFANKDSGKAQVTWDTAQHSEGTRALKAAITDDAYTAGWASAAVPVRVGDFYRAGALLKTTSAVYGAYLLVEFFDGAGKTVVQYPSEPLAGTNDWTAVTVDAWAPGGAVSMRVDLVLTASGTAWADSLWVTQPSENRAVNSSNEYTVGLAYGVQGRAAFTWAGNGTSAIDGSVSHSGWKSARSQGDSADDQTGWVGQDVPVEPGKVYDYATWVKTDTVATKAALVAVFKRANGTVLSQVDLATTSGTHDWTQIGNLGHIAPANAAFVRLDVRLTGSGIAWFDDLNLVGPVAAHPSVLFTTADVATLESKASDDGEGEAFISVLKDQSDGWNVGQLQNLAWSVDPWSTVLRGVGDGVAPTTSPTGTASIGVGIQVSGHGTVYIDDVRVDRILDQGSTTAVAVANAGFENGTSAPDSWALATSAGSARAALSTVVRAGNGSKSVEIATDSLDTVTNLAMKSAARLVASAGQQYLYQAEVRVDDPGVTVQLAVTYYDSSGVALRTDRSSAGESISFATHTNFGMGTSTTGDAALWTGLGDAGYAEKASLRLIYQLREMHTWIVRQMQGNDPRSLAAFYSVTRTTNYLAQTYDAIAAATQAGEPVISAAQDSEIRYLFSWIGSQFQNTRYYDTLEAAQVKNNITLDAHGALAMLAMVFPENTDSAVWYESGLGGIEWMLANVVTDEGAWPESARYQGGIMRTLLPVLVGVKNAHPGDAASNFFDYAPSDPLAAIKNKLKKLVSWFVTVQTPVDPVSYYPDPVDSAKRVTNVALTPGVDDANWEPTWFADLAWAASQYEASDAELAGELAWTWNRGGRLWSPEATPGNALASFALVKPEITAVKPNLQSTSTDFFYQIIRNDVGQDDEDYLLFEAGDYHIHGHYGSTGFSLWADGVPLLLDSGVVDYGQSLVQWYRRTSAQNRISLYTDTGLNNIKYKGPWNSSVLPSFFSSGLDYVGGDTAVPTYADPDATTAARRHIYMVKEPFEAYVVWDDMRGVLPQYVGAASWLNALTPEPIDYSGPLATVHGYKAVDLDIRYLDPGITVTEDDFGTSGLGGTRYTNATGSTQINTQQSIKVPLTVNSGAVQSLMVLYPRATGATGLTYGDLAVAGSPPGVRVVKVTDSTGAYFLVAVNAGASLHNAEFANSTRLKDAKANTTYTSTAGTVTVPLPANSISVLQVIP